MKKDLELTCTKVAIFNCSCFCCILVTRALTLSLFNKNVSVKLRKNPVTKLSIVLTQPLISQDNLIIPGKFFRISL